MNQCYLFILPVFSEGESDRWGSCVCVCVFVCLWLGEIAEVFLLLFVHLMIFGEVNVPHEPSHNLS